MCTDTVRKWRRRFAASRLPGLTDAPRSGRPAVFTAADRAEVIALACALPAETGVPLSRWSCPDLARELAARCRAGGLGIHHPPEAGPPTRSSPGSTGPGSSSATRSFAAKAARVLDLYAGIFDGQPASAARTST